MSSFVCYGCGRAPTDEERASILSKAPPDAPIVGLWICKACFLGAPASDEPESEERGASDEECDECGGHTVQFRGRGLDMQYRICTHVGEPGHKTMEQCRQEVVRMRLEVNPSGRTG